MQQGPAIHARTKFFPQRIDKARNPFVIFRAVNPRRKVPAVFYFPRQRAEAGAGIRQVVQHTDGEGVVKNTREWQMINVSLNDVRVFQFAGCSKRSFHRVAEIHAYYIARAPARGQWRVTTFSATAFQHHLIPKELRTNRRDPTQKLIRVELIGLDEMLPLPTKVFGGRGFIGLEFFRRAEARDTANNRKDALTGIARESALHDLGSFRTRYRGQRYCTGARRTSQVVE